MNCDPLLLCLNFVMVLLVVCLANYWMLRAIRDEKEIMKMSNFKRPIHLDGYDVTNALCQWKLGSLALNEESGRCWFLNSYGDGTKCRCELSWKFGDSQIGAILKVAPTPEEAVWLALDEFEKWVKATERLGS